MSYTQWHYSVSALIRYCQTALGADTAFPLGSDVMLCLTLGDTLDITLGPVLSEGRRGDEETVSSAAAGDRWCCDRRSFLTSVPPSLQVEEWSGVSTAMAP